MSIQQRLFSAVFMLLAFATGISAAEPVHYKPPIPTITREALYPINSAAMGMVTLVVSVEEDGRVSEVEVVKSIPSLDEPSIRAAKQWRFAPAQIDGKPIPSKATISFVYDRGLTPFTPARPSR